MACQHLATADGCGTFEIMRRSRSKRWDERFMQEGVEGLLRDKTRKPSKAPLPAEIVQRVVDLAADNECVSNALRKEFKAEGVKPIERAPFTMTRKENGDDKLAANHFRRPTYGNILLYT